MRISFNSIKSILAVWTVDGSGFVYHAVPTSITGNEQLKSIRFELREVDGQDDDFQIVIRQKADGSHVFKTDYYEDPDREYLLSEYVADDELLYHFYGKEGIAYFHLRSSE